MLSRLSLYVTKSKKLEIGLKNKIYINKNYIIKLMKEMLSINKFNQYLINNFKYKDHIIFNIVNISELLEILNSCIKEQFELQIDGILEHFPDIDIDNICMSKEQNAVNFIKCFNSVNRLPNNRCGYKVWNKPLDINRYQITCEPRNVDNIKYVICDVFGDKIIFETWRLYLDKYNS
jgi:hypothetical protein